MPCYCRFKRLRCTTLMQLISSSARWLQDGRSAGDFSIKSATAKANFHMETG
ncbi:unnamed protein product [Knipowitschia caucasica]